MSTTSRALFLLAAGGLLVACSSSDDTSSSSSSSGEPGTFGTSSGGTSNGGTTSNGGATSGGTSNGGTSNGGTSNGGTQTVEQCIAACEAKYPKGKTKGDAIDACWASKCPACQNMQSTGKLYGPTSGSCSTEVSTPAAACSTCTAQKCCSAWDACFSDADCTALNSCAVACYQ